MTSTDSYESVLQRLMDMDSEEFNEVVNRDLRRNSTPEEYDALRSPELVGRWYISLVLTSKSVDGQLAASRQDFRSKRATMLRHLNGGKISGADQQIRTEWYETEAFYASERAKKLRFKAGLDQFMVEAKRLQRIHAANLAQRVKELEQAITEHRNSFPPESEPDDGDIALWETIKMS